MMNSRRSRVVLLPALLVTFIFGASRAQAAPIIIDTVVDENCHGTLNGFLGLETLPCAFTTDPGPGGLAGAMTYNLLDPPGLVAGDVRIAEPGTGFSDLIRFNPVVGGGSLFFYSDTDGGVDALADIGLPTLLNTNLVTLPEVSLGALGFGLIYQPTAGQPGFVAGASVPVQYTFISDSPVPEPGTLVLVGSGLGAFIANRRRRRSA